jgi:hypothetical protein
LIGLIKRLQLCTDDISQLVSPVITDGSTAFFASRSLK